MEFYTGIDLGNKKVDITIMDEKGNIQTQNRVDADIKAILPIIHKYGKEQRIVFETSCTYYWLSDGLLKAGYTDQTMAHALKLAHITKAKVKTDRRDSKALADLHRLNFIPESYIYPKNLRPLRDLARRRMSVVQMRSSEFRTVKHLLRRHGMTGLSRNAIPSMKEEIFDVYRGYDEHLDDVLEDAFDFNKAYTNSINRIESKLSEGLQEDAVTQLLMGIPGIGVWLSKYIRLEVESIDRFQNMRAFNSWCRVSPGVAQSGDKSVRGRGSKQGNAHMKYALMQAATNAIRVNSQIKAYYQAHLDRRRGSGGKMVCINIIARKICMAVWHCFHGRPFDIDRLFSLKGFVAECA
jgi:transposase